MVGVGILVSLGTFWLVLNKLMSILMRSIAYHSYKISRWIECKSYTGWSCGGDGLGRRVLHGQEQAYILVFPFATSATGEIGACALSKTND